MAEGQEGADTPSSFKPFKPGVPRLECDKPLIKLPKWEFEEGFIGYYPAEMRGIFEQAAKNTGTEVSITDAGVRSVGADKEGPAVGLKSSQDDLSAFWEEVGRLEREQASKT